MLSALGLFVLAGLGLLGWEGYSLTRSDDAAITNVIRLAFDAEPGAVWAVSVVGAFSGGVLGGHWFWCPRPKKES